MTRPSTLVLFALLALTLGACHRHARARAAGVPVYATAGGIAQPTVGGRRYQNLLRVAGRDMNCDPRGLASQEVSPGLFSLQGCGMVRDYVMVCRHHHRCDWVGIAPVEQVAMQETQCASGQIQLALTGPVTRTVTACGQTLQYALACGPGGCAWTRGAAGAMMMQTAPDTTVIVVADDASSAGTYVTEPAVTGADDTGEILDLGAAGTLQSLLATQIAAIRGCTGGQPITLTVHWSADGRISVGVGAPFAGTSVEACVQQAVGPVQIQAPGSEGAIQATL